MKVWCLILDYENKLSGNPFDLDIVDDASVHRLKGMAKEESAPTLNNIVSSHLTVFRCTDPHTPFSFENRGVLGKQIADAFKNETVMELNPMTKLATLSLGDDEVLFVKHPTMLSREVEHPDVGTLRLFHQFLWGKGETALSELSETSAVDVSSLEDSGDISTVDATVYDLNKIPGYEENKLLATKFYIRQEYFELDRYMEREGREDRNVLLYGQPGIGKTIYLTYCLTRRLAAGKPTCLFQSPFKRYLIARDGVHSVSTDPLEMAIFLNKYKCSDALTLFNMNVMHEKVTEDDCYWKTLIASSSLAAQFKPWSKKVDPKYFVMRSWSWEEIWVTRTLVPPSCDRIDENAWKEAFIKYGGVARHLFCQSDSYLDDEIEDAIITTKLKETLSLTQLTHHVIMIEPEMKGNFIKQRSHVTMRFITRYVAMQVYYEQAMPNLEESFSQFVRALQRTATRATAAFAFEQVGHRYIRGEMKSPIRVYELTEQGHGRSHILNISHIVDHCDFAGDLFPRTTVMVNSSNKYHQTRNQILPFIHSFVLETRRAQKSTKVSGIVLFKFIVGETDHITLRQLREWWDASRVSHPWTWRLVFVVPATTSSGPDTMLSPIWFQSKKQPITAEIPGMNLKQYVWPVNVAMMQRFLSRRVDAS